MNAPQEELPLEATISRREREWAAAFARKDIAALQGMMADGYALVIAVEGMPLQVVGRNAWLEALDHYEIQEASVEHIHVRIYDRVAVVVMLWRQQASLDGADRSAVLMLTDIWLNVGGEWKLAERHSSRPEHPGAARPRTESLECEVC